ncbi:MAG: hypothetical protein ACLQUY_25705, partial [Ktedonobacterales bacterium]
LYVSIVTDQNPADPTSGVTSLYELEHILSSGTGEQLLATFNGDLGQMEGVNARLIACAGAVWDMTLHTFVTFPAFPGGDFGLSIALAGNDLAVTQGNETAATVLIFDTAELPHSAST